jgi:hypothetical protein
MLTTVSGLTPPRQLLSPASHHHATYCLRSHTTTLPTVSSLTPPRYLLSPASHHHANSCFRSHTTTLTPVSGVTTPCKLVSPASHHHANYYLRPHTTTLPTVSASHHHANYCFRLHTTTLPTLSGLTPPNYLLSPDSLVFGCFQLLMITDLYKEQDQLRRQKIKTKKLLNPEVMSSRNKEICNLKR